MRPIHSDSLVRQEHSHNRYFVRVEAPFIDVLKPEFWARADRLKTGDIVRCQAADLSFDLELVAFSKGVNGILMKRWPYGPEGTKA
jgi:hypothetical protein